MFVGLRRNLAMLFGRRPPRMQVGALCVRGTRGERQVLMITSRGTGRWIIPKGWPMKGRGLAEAAAQEAWEEAGVRGDVAATEIGRYHYGKAQDAGFSVPCEVRVFLLTVDDLATDFPETSERRRKWFAPDEAAKLVAEPELAALLQQLNRDRI
ncbi:NUDIX hydrolase [Paracoccus pacificus]|uniref:NUDIX hydrolase n=1 Tax=Paracoccus pacificus TaxID=1463598 RepID=A0ABW4RA80_9RHOB